MKKILAVVLALAMVFAFASCGKKTDPSSKSEGSMTYEEYQEAAMDSDVVIEGYITAKSYAAAYGNCNLILQDGDGAYFVYRMACTDADDAKLVIGQKVVISGIKTAWAGEVEIKEGSASYTIVDETYTFDAKDVTSVFNTEDELIKSQNMSVSVKGAEVSQAPMYNWDGSGQEGSDIYFSATIDGVEHSFVVESDLCGKDTDVYKAVYALKVGDKVDLQGFLYWYNGAQMWITAVSESK